MLNNLGGGVLMATVKKMPYTSRFTKFESNIDSLDPDRYEEMVWEGLADEEIAHELNVNTKFLEGMKKDIVEEY